MNRCLILLYLLLSIPCKQAFAQFKENVFKNFTQEEGLPSNEAYCIFEDSRHYLWIGTDLGVVRFNGNKFESYNLPDNVVFKIKEDKKGRIWFFNHKAQLAYFENEKIHNYQYNDSISRYIKNINITDAYIDDSDNIFMNSSRGENFLVSAKGNVHIHTYLPKTNILKLFFTINQFSANGYFAGRTLYNNRNSDSIQITLNTHEKKIIYELALKIDQHNHYGCINNNNSFYFFSGKSIIRLNKDGSYTSRQIQDEILCINKKDDKIFIGLRKSGAVILNADLTDYNSSKILPGKTITSITFDYEGGLWFSTLEKGLFYIKNINIIHYNVVSDPQIFRLHNVDDQFLVFATNSGLFKLKEGKVLPVIKKENLNISDIQRDKQNNLFVGFSFYKLIRGIIAKDIDGFFKNIYLINTPYEFGQMNRDSFIYSRVHVASIFNSNFRNTGSSAILDEALETAVKTAIPFKPAHFFVDTKNNTWAATNDGLYQFNTHDNNFKKFDSTATLLNKGITCIREMDNGPIVAGIRFEGIVIIRDTAIIATITENEGLLSNKIRYLMPVGDQLWAATARGISVICFSSYNPLKYTIINIGKNDGFYNVTINHLAKFQGNIFTATSNGLYSIENINEFFKRKHLSIPFYINTINYYLGDTSSIKQISLPYQKNRLLIKYNAVSFNSPEAVKYYYRFEKSDTNWHSTTNPELLLENLEPGTYNLQLQAGISNKQRFSAIQSLAITVEKPWWQNNWLRLLMALLVTGAIYVLVTSRIRKIKASEQNKTELNAKLTELEQTALRSQMNPHFIFNCLTSIQQLIVSGNKTDANEYLVKFARLIRRTLELSAHPFISIRDEMAYLNEYLLLEQLRLSGQFEYTILSGESINIDNTYIPNMMLQPVVENCIRHGIKSLEKRKGVIKIKFTQHENTINCIISDNGVGRSEKSTITENDFTKHKSYGVDIIRKRLQAFSAVNQQDTGITINDLYDADGKPAGTEVILHLPFKNSI